MRLVTFTTGERDLLGAVDGSDVLDLGALGRHEGSGSLPDSMLGLIQAGPAAWSRVGDLVDRARTRGHPSDSARPLSQVRLLAPIPRPAKNVVCLGLNYKAHLEETAALPDLPKVPVFFTKAVTSIVAPEDPILHDAEVSTRYDWEAELGVVIGLGGRRISEADALNHVFGYTCFNDVSAREVQRAHEQWFLGKSLDGTCPFGPWIVTADEIADPQALEIECRVNGVVKQHSNTSDMLFGIAPIIASLSRGLTLEPGDLIATGTPSGVGYTRRPPEYLKPGDIVEVEIEGVGLLRNPVADIRHVSSAA